ncbi:MAG: hypothetical protein CMP47_12535 [Rickettsiales bacterium]|nr:hypothetical protein [Rickettsiales bacterium]
MKRGRRPSERPPPPMPQSQQKGRAVRKKSGLFGTLKLNFVRSSGVMTSVEIKVSTINDIDKAEWRSWYAWFPVKTQNAGWQWLTKVYRRKHHLVVENKQPYASPASVTVRLDTFIYDSSEAVLIDKLGGNKKDKIPKLLADPKKCRDYKLCKTSKRGFTSVQIIE